MKKIAFLCAVTWIAVGFAQDKTSRVLGKGWGLDQVIVAVSDPKVARDVFQTKLGFTLIAFSKFSDAGLEHAVIPLSAGTGTYIELMWLLPTSGRLRRNLPKRPCGE